MSFPLSISIDSKKTLLTFDSLEELTDWLEQNHGFWSDISAIIENKKDIAPVIFNNVKNIVGNLRNAQKYSPHVSSSAQHVRALKDLLNQLSVNPNFFVVGSENYENLLAVKSSGSTDSLIGALYMTTQSGLPSANMNQDLFASAFDYMLITHGIDKRYLASSKSAATRLKTSLDVTANEIEEKAKSLDLLIESANGISQKLLKQKKTYEEYASKGFGIARKKFLLRLQQFKQSTQKSYADDYAAIRKTYQEHMGMKAPVSYWTTRAAAYRKSSAIKAACFGSVALAGAFLLWSLSGYLTPDPSLSKEVYFVRSGLFLLFVTLYFWLCRIFTRLYLSDVHLAIDAKERSVMAETYLALVHENTISVEDRTHILQALFRPTKSGIVKDDAAPNFTPHGMVTK